MDITKVREWINGTFKEFVCGVITGVFGAIVLALLATVISVLSGYLFPEVLGVLKLKHSPENSLWTSLFLLELFNLYITIIVSFIVLFGLREYLTTANLKNEREKLHQTIRSMPPIGIMSKFKKLYDFATNYIAGQTLGSENQGKEKLEQLKAIDDSIRLCTDALSSLAFNFQKDDLARFAANVMTYHSVEGLGDEDKARVLNLLDGMIELPSFDGIKGYLMLDKALTSSTTIDSSFAVDELAENFALPIPELVHSRHNSSLSRLLPGAPVALEFGVYIIEDTHTIRDEINLKCDIPTSIGDNIHKYFTETDAGRAIRSFISLRLTRFNHDINERSPLGVVNIHCDKVKLFADDEVARSFVALSQPFLDLIAKLIFRRYELQTSNDGIELQ